MLDSGYYNHRPNFDDFPTINNQQVVTFVSEGTHNTMQEAVKAVTKQLTKHVDDLNRTYGNSPRVVSVSHTSGYTEVTRFYATLVAAISV